MSGEATKETELELAHVLFIDIVGFSKRLINEQRALLDTLNRTVGNTSAFRREEAAGKLSNTHRALGRHFLDNRSIAEQRWKQHPSRRDMRIIFGLLGGGQCRGPRRSSAHAC